MSEGSSTAWFLTKAVILLGLGAAAGYKGYLMHKEIEELADQRKETDK